MKLRQVLKSHGALKALSQTGVKGSTAIRLSRVQTALEIESKEYENIRKQKIEMAGLKGIVDSAGVLQFNKDHSEEEKNKYVDSFKSLLDDLDLTLDGESVFNTIESISINDMKTAPTKDFPEGCEINIPHAILTELDWLIT